MTEQVLGSIPQDMEIIVNIAYRWRGDALSTSADFGRYPMRSIAELDAAVEAVRDRIVRGLMGLPEWDRILTAASEGA